MCRFLKIFKRVVLTALADNVSFAGVQGNGILREAQLHSQGLSG